MYTTMGIAKIKALLDNMWKDIATFILIRMSMESFKLELGVKGSIFEFDYGIFRYLGTDCWVKSLWKFIHGINIIFKDEVKEGEVKGI